MGEVVELNPDIRREAGPTVNTKGKNEKRSWEKKATKPAAGREDRASSKTKNGETQQEAAGGKEGRPWQQDPRQERSIDIGKGKKTELQGEGRGGRKYRASPARNERAKPCERIEKEHRRNGEANRRLVGGI